MSRDLENAPEHLVRDRLLFEPPDHPSPAYDVVEVHN